MTMIEGAGVRAARKLGGGDVLFRRWLGCWIDFLAVGGLVLLSIMPFALGDGELSDGQALTVFFIMVAVVLGYFTLWEGLAGRTLGKLISGTIVVDAEGNPPGLWRALVRTLLRLIEVNPFLLGGFPAGIAVAFTRHKQRLGDLAAGTYVVPVKHLKVIQSRPAVAEVFS